MTVSSWKWHKGHIRFDQGSLGEIKLMVNFFLDDLKIWTAWKSSNVFIWSTSNLVLYPQLIFLYWDTVKKPPPSQISFVSAVRHSMFFFICIEFNIKKGNKMDYLLISTHLIGFRTSTLLKCSSLLYLSLLMIMFDKLDHDYPSHCRLKNSIYYIFSWRWITVSFITIFLLICILWPW